MAEKSLDDIPRELRVLYRKGFDALQRENLDYAIELFMQILDKEPACYEFRESLRNAQHQKARGGVAGFFRKVFSTANASPQIAKAQLALLRNPLEAMQIAEQILNGDPYNSAAHNILADAAVAAEMPRVAVLSLAVLARNAPKDKQVNIRFARALADIGQIPDAEEVMNALSREHPTDPDVAQAAKNICARRTLREGGYEALEGGTGSYRDILRDKEEAVSLEQEQRTVKAEDVAGRLITEYEAKLKQEPKNLKLLRSLAELYTQKKQFERALRYYDLIKASPEAGSDPSLDRAIAETHARRFDHRRDQLDRNAPGYAGKAAKLEAEKQTYLIEECQKRVERFPSDLAIRFEMGALFFQAGKVNEAIQEFQRAQSNPHKRIAAMNYLGLCFARRGMDDLAVNTLQKAIKEKLILDDEKKELIYNLGGVFEKMGRAEEAIEQFKLIYEVDIGYKDVAAKVDAYYAGQ